MPSITENPEQFFNELSTPKEEKPSVAPVSEKPVVSDQKSSKEASITEDPNAFFSQLEKPAEPYKKETPQSVFLGQVAGKKPNQLENFDIQSLNSLQPDELHDFAMSRKDIPLTDEQLRSVYDFHKNKAVTDANYGTPTSLREFMDMTNRWAEPIGQVGNDIAHTIWSAAKGAGKLAYRTADYVTTPDMSFAENRKYYTPEQQAEIKKQHAEKAKAVEDAYQSATEPIVGFPEELSWMGTKIGAGGMDWYDRASEALGLQDHEKSFQNFKARRAVESAQAQYYQEHPTELGRIMNLPIVKQGLEYVVKSQMPDAAEWQASHPNLTREQAQEQLDAIAKDHVDNQLKESESRIAETDPDIATASTFLAPEGLGMGTMGALGMGARVAGELTPKITQGLKYLGKSDAEINAMYSSAQELQKQAAQRGLQEVSQPSLLEKAAGKAARAIDWTSALAKGVTEKIPEQVRPFVPYVAGGAAGGIYGHEQGRSVIGDVLHGIEVAGLLKSPALIRDIEEARRLSAGGTKGTFETMAGFPNVSAGAAKILRLGGKNVDNLLSNAAEYARSGIHATALAVATGALDSASPEEMNNLLSTGLIYGLGGHAFERIKGSITGHDPILERRKKAQQDVDNLRTFANLSPETQQTLNDVTSWNNVVENQQQKANDARLEYLNALQKESKDAPELRKKWQAQTNTLSNVMRANVQTRNEYGRLFVDQLSRNLNLANGTLKAGQNNVGVHILNPDQIYQKFRQDPANATKSDADVREAAAQAGFYSTPEGAIEYRSGMGMEPPQKDLVFDRSKPSIVINADHLKARMKLMGESANQALNHEFGHHVSNIPEFREANKDAEALLFSQEIKDPSGAVVATTSGRYSPNDLVDMYENNYMKAKTPEQVKQISQLTGLWDNARNELNKEAVAAYMKDEILADLNAETLSSHLGKDLDSGTQHLMDLARIKTKKNLLEKAINKFAGLGGKGDPVSQLTGAEFSPEVMAANRQAMRALQSLQGEVSLAVAAPDAPKISRVEMMKNCALQERAKYSGLFKTKTQVQVYDAKGNPVGAPVDIANPNVAEGSWQYRNGSLKQVSGYGQRPEEALGIQIPEGGTVVVGKQIVREADGVTPVFMSPKEAKQLQKDRSKIIRDALNTPDVGAPNRFEPTGDPDGTWRGTFTPLQIQAIKDLPEGIIPKSIKDNMLKINDMIVKGDGSRFLADYAAVMNDNGRYTPYSAKIYDLVPIGMHLSKDGHFLTTTISVGRMFDKLNKWSERMPARLAPWGGSKEAFFKEFTEKYLQNWQNGFAGETGLAGTPAEAIAKKNIFNDFLNLTTKDTAPLNPDRTKTPRKRGDVRGKDIDRTIMSVRLDHIAELMDNENAPKVPVSYQKAKFNMMPADEPAPAGREEERKPSAIDLGITAAHSKESRPFSAQYVAPTTEEEKFHADRRILHSGMYEPKGNINFMPASKLDEAHAKAIESGDMEEAQRLVDEKAKQKGGILVFHGTTSESGDINVPAGTTVAAHVTTSIEEADYFAGLTKDYLNEDLGKNAEKVIKNWYLFGDVFDPTNKDHIKRAKKAISPYKEIAYDPEDDVYNPEEWQHHAYDFFEKNSEVRNAIKKSGFVGYKDRENPDDSYPWSKSPNIAVFDPNNIKSADPATYDDAGNVIPLSQRFDTSKPDIRFMPKSQEEENRYKLVAKYDDLIKSSSSRGSAVIEHYPEKKDEDGDIESYENWVVSSTKNDKYVTITNNNDGTFDVSREEEGMIYGISYERAESEARNYVEKGQSQDQYNLLRDARSEIMHEIHIPTDMVLRDVRDTANDSIYYKIDHILSRDEDGDPDEKESYKLSIRNHDPSPFREREFGANDYWVEVPKNPYPIDMANAVAKIEKWLADHSNQSNDAGNVIPLSQRFDASKPDIRFMPKSDEQEPKNLVAVHNTSAEKIEYALKTGGFAVPSVAIIRNDRSQFDSFGDITLVAPKGLINPEEEKKSKVFNADVYSPRYPSVSYALNEKDGKKIWSDINSKIKDVPEDRKLRFSFQSNQRDKPLSEELTENPAVQLAFVYETGNQDKINWPEKTEESKYYQEKGIENALRQKLSKWWGDKNSDLHKKFVEWVEKLTSDLGITDQEKLFAGYTPSGTRRYLPHTIENVVKMMTKSIRDGEGFNYGVGSIRSKAAKQFRTMKSIEKSQESIISKEQMERLKDEVNNEFEIIVDESAKTRANQGRDGFVMDAVSSDINAFAEGGSANMKYLREMYPEGAPYKLWSDYLEKLRGLPTEYFEAKIQRGVDLNEFAGAVVPEGTSQDLINKLENKGLDVVTYPKGDKAARAKAVQGISGKRSDIAFMPKGQTQAAKPIDWSVFTQKTEKPLSTIRAYAVPQQQKDKNY
jgi:hypothetical protein